LIRTGQLGAGFSLSTLAALHPNAAPAFFSVQDTDQQTLTVAANWAPVDLDPHGAYDPGSGLVMTGSFESLIKLESGATNVFVPSLAESWESNDDLSTWTFHIRQGVVFHDGAPLDAGAVRASFERLFALGLAPTNVLGRFIQSMDQIRVQDDYTVVFELGTPQRLFEAAMAAPYGTAIVNVAAAKQHEVDGDWGRTWAQTNGEGLGTGPYRVTSYDPADSTVMEQFDGYWRGWEGDHFERIVVRVVAEAETRRQLIEQGDAGIVENMPLDALDDLVENASLAVDHQTSLVVRFFAITVADPLTSPEARQALCWAFPYEEVLQGVFLGYAKPAQGAVAERCHGFAAVGSYSTDLAKAKALLDEAGIVEGTTLTTMSTEANPLISTIAELFKVNLAEIGINLDIQLVDFATYVGMFYGDLPADERPNLLPSFWQPDYDDAWSHLWPLVSCDAWARGNGGHYCNDRVEELLAIARDAPDEASYLDALAKAQQIVANDDPAGIYFAQPEWITVLRQDVGGFVHNPVVGSILDYYALHPAS
jgi:peptide/nickel transport system substrate-binding protein